MSPDEIVAVVRGIGGLLEPGAGDAWRIALAQVAIVAYQYAIWRNVLFVIMGLWVCLAIYAFWDSEQNGGDSFGAGVTCVFFAICFLIAGLSCQMAYYGRASNAEFYAIRSLIGMIVPQ